MPHKNIALHIDEYWDELSILSLHAVEEADFAELIQSQGGTIRVLREGSEGEEYLYSIDEGEDGVEFTFDHEFYEDIDDPEEDLGLGEFVTEMKELPKTVINVLTSKTAQGMNLLLIFMKAFQEKYPNTALMAGDFGASIFFYKKELQELYTGEIEVNEEAERRYQEYKKDKDARIKLRQAEAKKIIKNCKTLEFVKEPIQEIRIYSEQEISDFSLGDFLWKSANSRSSLHALPDCSLKSKKISIRSLSNQRERETIDCHISQEIIDQKEYDQVLQLLDEGIKTQAVIAVNGSIGGSFVAFDALKKIYLEYPRCACSFGNGKIYSDDEIPVLSFDGSSLCPETVTAIIPEKKVKGFLSSLNNQVKEKKVSDNVQKLFSKKTG